MRVLCALERLEDAAHDRRTLLLVVLRRDEWDVARDARTAGGLQHAHQVKRPTLAHREPLRDGEWSRSSGERLRGEHDRFGSGPAGACGALLWSDVGDVRHMSSGAECL